MNPFSWSSHIADRDGRCAIRSPYWRFGGGAIAIVMLLAAVDGAEGGRPAPSAVAAAAGAWIGFRCWRVGLTDDGEQLSIRNVLRGRVIGWAEIDAVAVAAGALTGRRYSYIAFRSGARTTKAAATLTYSRRRADAICALIEATARGHGIPCAIRGDALVAHFP